MRKVIPILAVLMLFGFSTAFAHDEYEYDNEAGPVLIAGLALVTAAVLIASHDRHAPCPPAPRHVPERPREYRGMDSSWHHDGRGGDCSRHRDGRPGEDWDRDDEWRR